MSAKEAIARETAGLIQPGQVVLIDSGTTPLAVAGNLAPELRATVITPSPPAAMALGGHARVQVIVLGGILEKSSMSVIGNTTLEALSRIRADVCVLGVCSLHNEIGVTTVSYEEAEIKRMMIHNSSEVIAAVTGDKLGTAASFVVTGIDHISVIVTELSVSDEKLAPYADAGIQVIRAGS